MKNEIRAKMRDKMKLLSTGKLREKSEKIQQKVRVYLDKVQNVCIYISKDHEVETKNLIRELLNVKNILIPFVDGNNLKISQIHNHSNLQMGKYGVLETKNKQEFEGNIDLIIVPGLAFDKKGNRLGRGKGYYDRFLKRINGLKVGLAFDEQVIDNLPIEKHDVPLDLIITDKQIIKP